ncbi:MAG TPA: methyltransferase domain-containing protein [Acetobacteraceae bacterium]|nr:methyltransferase domain-containing protein [Acetobacteraceae bacterium]
MAEQTIGAAPPPVHEEIWATGTSRGVPIPWWAKISAKMVLARMPVGYRAWARLGLFRHGRSDRDAAVPVNQYERARAYAFSVAGEEPRHVLELGPGDALGTLLAGAARGAASFILMDAGDFATREMAAYRAIADHLAALGRPVPQARFESREALLDSLGGRYLTGGVPRLADIPDGTVDLNFSNAVLEHVPRAEMPALFRALFRVAAPGGVGHHFVDLSDHLGGGLNSLRFSERVWEAGWFAARSGFYTNRLREHEIIAMARNAGFETAVLARRRFAALPLPRRSLAAPFRDMSDEQLSTACFTMVLRKP